MDLFECVVNDPDMSRPYKFTVRAPSPMLAAKVATRAAIRRDPHGGGVSIEPNDLPPGFDPKNQPLSWRQWQANQENLVEIIAVNLVTVRML